MRYAAEAALVAMLVSVAATGCGSRPETAEVAQDDHHGDGLVSRSAPPAGPSVDTVTTRHEPEAALRAARALVSRDPRAAAAFLKQAVRFLKDEAALSSGPPHADLMAAVHAMERIERDLRRGRAPGAASLDALFVRAHGALAEHHVRRAIELHGRQDNRRAGGELLAAVSHLAIAGGYELPSAPAPSAPVLADGRRVATNMTIGSAWTEREVADALEAVDLQARRLAEPGRI